MADHLIHHWLLGYVPTPGFRGSGTTGWSISVDADGLRSCGDTAKTDSREAILAVGDSYTYGEDVNDTEAWPAQLQRLSGRRVLNGAVSGYGFDQIVLRTEQLAGVHEPSTIVVGFIADDVRRTEMRRLWWRDKPWFAIDRDQLVIKGSPVPNRKRLLPLPLRHRVEHILIELPEWVQHLLGYHIRVHPAGSGLIIAQRLVERLASLQLEHRIRVVLMALYHPQVWTNKAFAVEQRRITRDMLDCAEDNGLATLDTHQRFAAEPAPQRFYFRSHMNARGHSMVASLLSSRLPELQGSALS
jgi:lysophospholipase L1-like esterase